MYGSAKDMQVVQNRCQVPVVFWLGFWFWLGHLGAALGRFVASLAVVGAWGDHPPSGVVGGGPRVTWRCHWLCRADVSPWLGLGPILFERI
jgi:hypothetical protein